MKKFILFSLLFCFAFLAQASTQELKFKPLPTPQKYTVAYHCGIDGDYRYALIYRNQKGYTEAIRFHNYKKGLRYYNIKINFKDGERSFSQKYKIEKKAEIQLMKLQ